MPAKQKWLILEIVAVAAYVWYCYSFSRIASDIDSSSEAEGWDLMARGCYSIARTFGTWGMKAENHRNAILDAERMI